MWVAILSEATAGQLNEPPIPYIDNGACPFECCVYREWQAQEDVPAYLQPKDDIKPILTLKTSEKVLAKTGFVITKSPGIVKVLRSISVGYLPGAHDIKPGAALDLRPGDSVYLLHYMGEGNSLFWFQGKTYYDQILFGEPGSREMPDPPFKQITEPEYDWWVKIQTEKKQILWLKNPPYFKNADACQTPNQPMERTPPRCARLRRSSAR